MKLVVLTIFLGQFIFKLQAIEWDQFVNEVEEAVDSFSTYILPTNNDKYFTSENNNTEANVTDFGTFDFIIVGGGAAGGVLARRLTEEPFDVLVIEAGETPPEWSAVIGLAAYNYRSKYNWGYYTTPQNTSCLAMNSERCFYIRGKALGGSSVVNGGIYVRGNAKDYDEWEQLGNPGWSYKDCLPYFKKSERGHFTINETIDEEYHGFDGVQSISILPNREYLTTNLLKALKSIGIKEIDYNGQTQDGVGKMQFYLDKNTRTSTNYAFIQPVVNRANLNITLESLVTKILISDEPNKPKAEGVEFVKNGIRYVAKARKEVIVSAGSINSPQVLMLSGIGPAAELQKHDIEVIADLPVGDYLYDHILFNVLYFRTNQVFYNNNTLLENLHLWREGKRPLVASGAHVVGFLTPETEFYITPASPNWGVYFNLKEEYTNAFKQLNASTDICLTTALVKPKSFGQVTLQSNDPRDFPLINTNWYSDPADLEAMYAGIQEIFKISESEVFKSWNATLVNIPIPDCDGLYERLSKDWYFCVLPKVTNSVYHAVGTTRMGPDPSNSVVNSKLKVHGIDRLRVVDAGVMPSHISGHTNAAVVMIAEKISDVIKQDWS